MIQCDKCSRIILTATNDGGAKLRTRTVLFTPEGQAYSICPSCKERVPVPVVLQSFPTQKTKLVVNV